MRHGRENVYATFEMVTKGKVKYEIQTLCRNNEHNGVYTSSSAHCVFLGQKSAILHGMQMHQSSVSKQNEKHFRARVLPLHKYILNWYFTAITRSLDLHRKPKSHLRQKLGLQCWGCVPLLQRLKVLIVAV